MLFSFRFFPCQPHFHCRGKISIENIHLFFPYKWYPFWFHQASQDYFWYQKIDWFFSLVEKPQPKGSIDKEKLRIFISKILIWDYFSLTEQACKSFSNEEKTILLNRYYRELYQIVGKIIFFLIYFLWLFAAFWASVCVLQLSFVDGVLEKYIFRTIGEQINCHW